MLFRDVGNSDVINEYIETLRSGECISERSLMKLCTHVSEIHIEECNVVPVNSPVTIVGDLHGQFFDLLHLLSDNIGGSPPDTNYVFLGDFVDRGHNSVETFCLLLCLKVKYPGHVTLLRGNHESRQITQVYGFYDECLRKYGNASSWRHCVSAFDYLPLAALIDNRVLCVHGGLSPSIRTIDQIRAIDRQQEIPHEGAFCDLVWSDPEDLPNNTTNNNDSSSFWQVSPRGAGYLFGSRVTDEFNEINALELIARAHQLVMEGKKYHFPNKNLVTVWSAPNYCYRCGNVAAILTLGEYGSYNNDDDTTTKIVKHPTDKNEHDDDSNELLQSTIMTHNNNKKGSSSSDGRIQQSFKFFQETENSQHGPKGEERAHLVPYFL